MTKRTDLAIQECQDNEFFSIAAIFPDEVKDLRDKCTGWVPLEMEIKIYPEESMSGGKEANTEVVLYVKCSDKYPESPPFIDIKHPKGISNEDLKILKSELCNRSKELAGREIILELVYHIRSFLYKHKRPQYQSFFEEMVSNQLKKEQEEAERLEKQNEELKYLERQTLLAIEEAKQRKIEALKDANKRTRFADQTTVSVEPCTIKNSTQRQRSRSTSICKDTCSNENLLPGCQELVNNKLKFSGKKEFNFIFGRCLGHSKRGCITYYGIDTLTGNPLITIKWTLNFNASHKLKGEEWEALQKEQGYYLQQIASIEQEFKTLRQLSNKYLVHYLGMNYSHKKDKIVVNILQEYISGCPIDRMYGGIQLTIPQLQYYTRQLLEALKYLHDNSIVHKNLRMSSLFVDNNGIIRVSDYSLDKRLYDLYRNLTKEDEIDDYPLTIGKGGKKSDIYRLGVLLLYLINQPPSNSPVIVPECLNPTFKDFLHKCLLVDEHERWSAEQLLSHPFLAASSIHTMMQKEIEIKDEVTDVSINYLMNECIQGSRLHNEFEIIKILGKGGFGHVWKVKNKLDSRVYALKKIRLNPSNKYLNRKIKREVKLLSRLNHENIVRYYNSWIEATPEAENSITNDASVNEESICESLGKPNSSMQWYDKQEEFSYEEECEDDYDDFIIFESPPKPNQDQLMQSRPDIDEDSNDNQLTLDLEREQVTSKIQQFMYIQMEFCEKSTLRTAIDNGLHKDFSLVWHLFREIVEGLHYIHQQAVIHRDLKPVNIFLDSKDHVKIGDFGLATDVISKTIVSDALFNDIDPQSKSEIDDETQTGRVGTTFYVAPEIAYSPKAIYTQKVDIYSLGIIFFEMCYPPPFTAMERNQIMSNLRHRDIIFPENCNELLTEEMVQLITWLLQHDVTKRPSSNELITSKYIPPLLMEETEINNLLHNTVSNPQSRMYKHMISALFDQQVSTEFDFTYDIDVFKNPSLKNKPTQLFSTVVDTLNKIMQMHGAVYFSVPTLMPKNSVMDLENCVHIMEHGGGIVMLPYNLRVPFARYIAHRETDYLKRYSLEKVFRQQKVFGCHPREQYEFAFDIITRNPNLCLPDAEVISTVSEIISEFSSLDSRGYYIRLNHASLLRAIFLYSEIDEKLENEIYKIAGKQRDKTITKSLLNDNLDNLQLSQRSISRLSQFVELEEGIEKIKSSLHSIMQKKSKASSLAKSSLKDLENIITLSQSLGLKLQILICPGLVHNITLFSGMLFQCVCKLKSPKRKDTINILAVGGRYDNLISSFKLRALSEGTKSTNQFGVGVSIAIESIIAAEIEANENQTSGVADFLIHSEDGNMDSVEATLLKNLWDFGVRAMVLYDKNMVLEDALDFCRNQGIPHMLVLRKEEPSIIKIRTIDKDRFTEKKIIQSELKEHVLKLCPKALHETNVKSDCVRSPSFSNIPPSNSSNISVNVRFLAQDKNHSNRKREQNIRTHVISLLQNTPSRFMEVIPVDLKMTVIGTVISYCDISANIDGIQRSFDSIIDEYNKHKKYLSQLCEEICDIRAKRNNCTIVLYSLPDSNFRVLL